MTNQSYLQGNNSPAPRTVDYAVARIARRQHGLVTTRQLNESGLTNRAIAGRVAAGRVHRVHRGVYAVGHAALSEEARRHAAVLAAGPGAALSHHAAAALWGV